MSGVVPREIPDILLSDWIRFNSYVGVENRDGCKEWTGYAKRGYGVFRIKEQQFPAHRIALALHLGGKLTAGLVVDHICNNKLCVNPYHLREVTLGFNVLRGDAPPALNARREKCKRGHELPPYADNPDRKCKGCVHLRERRRKLLSTMTAYPILHVIF